MSPWPSLAQLRRRCCRCLEWKRVYRGTMLGMGKGKAKRFRCADCSEVK